MLRRAPQAASLFLLLATLSLSNDGACDVLSAAPSPRIHIYDVPTDFTQPKLWFGVTRLLPYLRESKYFEPDPERADFFFIPHMMPFDDTTVSTRLFEYVRSTWPYLNRSIEAGEVRHFMTHTCDKVTGSCKYVERAKVGSYPPHWDPISGARVVGHVLWNGMRDGHDAGTSMCAACFQLGKDVQIPTAENACGPLCGYKMPELHRFSPWLNASQPQELLRGAALLRHAERVRFLHPVGSSEMTERDRPVELFYAGSINAELESDPSGRGELLRHHGGRAGWRVFNTHRSAALRSRPPAPVNFAEEMSNATFCFSPLGQVLGDTDRYVPAVLFGCVPVMLRSIRKGAALIPMALPLQEHPEVDWEAFGVLVDWDDIPTLHERLAALSLRDVARKRAAMARVWPRLLWSGLYGTSYLGEGAEADAFESLIDVLRVRLRAMAVRRSSGG